MAYTVSLSNRFKKDFRRCIKRGLNMKHITDAMDLLEATGMLPAKYRPHKLSGGKDGQWECHIEPDQPTRILSTDKKAQKAGGLCLALKGVLVKPTDDVDVDKEYQLIPLDSL